MAQSRWNSSFEARHTSSGTRERGQVPHDASCDTWDMRQLCVGRDLGLCACSCRRAFEAEQQGGSGAQESMAQSRWNSSFEARHNELRYERARPESHMPLMSHVTHGTCASCVWGVTWGYVRAAVEQPSRREAREARARARDGRGRAGGGRAHATRLAGLGALSGEQHHPLYTVVGQPRGPWEAPRFNKLFEDFRTDGHARGPALESRLNTRPTRSPRRSHSRNLALPLVTPRAARQLLYLVLVRSLWR